ncbi:cytochrome P450 [Infundibulicybe gibba]|nr:cytochrome P450 [Infundibulicybe gibba]
MSTFATMVLDIIILYPCYRIISWLFKPLLFVSPFEGLPGPRSVSWFKGNLGQLFNPKGLAFHQALVDRFGGMVKVYGFFGDEQLYISDPRALHHILIKDQDAFEETSVFIEKMVIPVFSVAQLKKLTPTFYEIADKVDILQPCLEQRGEAANKKTGKSVLDMSEWMSRVALETVGQAILGYSFDPLDSSHNNPYTSAVKELIPTIFSLSLVRQFAPFLSSLGRPLQKVKDMSDIMHETAQSILQEKREAIREGETAEAPITRDIISILLKANDRSPSGEQLSEAELTGQMTVLIFGAQDTTSSALSRLLYMLSIHPEIQAAVQDEVRAAIRSKQGGRLEYDEIMALPMLDAVLKETLRLYPPVPFVRRTAVKESIVSYSPSGHEDDVASITIPAGTTIFVGIAGGNRMESVWGLDAKEWKPQRWLAGEPKQGDGPRLPGIYSGMMTFLGGSRSCIGYKFAQIEMKILLATLLSRFSFSATGDVIVWNLSQIISPSVRTFTESGNAFEEHKGLPLVVDLVEPTY